jgi:hypothetical protein
MVGLLVKNKSDRALPNAGNIIPKGAAMGHGRHIIIQLFKYGIHADHEIRAVF